MIKIDTEYNFRGEEKHHPFRAKSDDVARPYEILDHESFSHPPIGLDGGILLQGTVLEEEQGNPLGDYLEKRTMRTGRFNSVTHREGSPDTQDDKEGIALFFNHPGKFFTSRGESYYAPNFTFNRGATKEDRRAALMDNLNDDFKLINNWEVVSAIISTYEDAPSGRRIKKRIIKDGVKKIAEEVITANNPHETQWRILATLQQNMVNDLIGLMYAYRIASATSEDSQLQKQSTQIRREVFMATRTYYETLMHPRNPSLDKRPFGIHKFSPALLQEIEGVVPAYIDEIRTQRETDMTYLTLAGALTFANEFKDAERSTVLIPLLGAYDLGPALRAVGYKGEIIFINPSHKLLTSETRPNSVPKRRYIPQPIVEEIQSVISGFEVAEETPKFIVFDDTLGTGKTMYGILADLRDAGIEVSHIRSLFDNNSWNASGDVFKKDNPNFEAYFESAIRKHFITGEQFIFTRSVTEKWIKENKARERK